jgi:trehalose 6-phosphate phosphatase
LRDLIGPVERLAARLGLETVPGRYVVEVRPAGVNKGAALRRLVDEHRARVAVYIGDDLGDLPAFDAVQELREAGGAGLTVASLGSDAPPQLRERADLVLDGPGAVVGFLVALAGTMSGR